MKEAMFVSGSRNFNENDLNKMIALLDEGKSIWVGIDCLGHGHNNACQEEYRKHLEQYYGNRLETTYCDGVCSYSYAYKLRESR